MTSRRLRSRLLRHCDYYQHPAAGSRSFDALRRVLLFVSLIAQFSSVLGESSSSSSSSSLSTSSLDRRLPRLQILAGLLLEDHNTLLQAHLIDMIQEASAKNWFSSIVQQQRENQESLLIDYRLFRGQSALRDVSTDDTAHTLLNLLQSLRDPSDEQEQQSTRTSAALTTSNAAAALLLLLSRPHGGWSDAAHEVVLGVNLHNMVDAEYKAAHRGQTDVKPWSDTHPLSDSDDLVHSILHRLCEGSSRGEGGHTGWANAKYWAAGGPKLQYQPDADDDDNSNNKNQQRQKQHLVRAALAQAAKTYAPNAVAAGVVVCDRADTPSRTHRIIQGGGKHRNVCVPAGWWDPFCFIDLIERQQQQPKTVVGSEFTTTSSNLRTEVDWLQELEMALLLRYELLGQHLASHRIEELHSNSSDDGPLRSLLSWETTTEAAR